MCEMEHNMKLHSTPFEKIKSGAKTYELRLYDEKRAALQAGDIIRFTNCESGEELCVRVVALHRFFDFRALYAALPLLKCGYTDADIATASPADMEAFYSAEEQSLYGVVGIEIELI